MLELRPICEHCNKELPSSSRDAMICTYECTFCKQCVDGVLENVCPNCGGGFCNRPVRPANNLNDNNYLGNNPATSIITHKAVDIKKHKEFSRKIKSTPPHER